MLRSTATRSVLRSFTKAPSVRSRYSAAAHGFRTPAKLSQSSNKRPHVLASLGRPTTSSVFYAVNPNPPPMDTIDTKHEQEIAQRKLEPDPEHVSIGSSVRHVRESSQSPETVEKQSGAIMADIDTIKETFSLQQVPKESLYIGAAGVLPYAATSLSTVYLAYDINHAHATGNGYLFSPETAHQLLDLVTPIQIGYGAVIISFLGAIHWGMEYSGYGGYHSYRRYMYGVIAPAIAWPTIFMPVEYALITQFFAFNFLYFADARATAKGWFPAWYSIYRFVLTFFVGASIVLTLVGRGRILHHDQALRSPVDYVKQDRDLQWQALENEEKERREALAKEEEGDSEDSETEDDSENSKEGSEDEDDGKKEGKKGEKDEKQDKKEEKKDEKDNKSDKENK